MGTSTRETKQRATIRTILANAEKPLNPKEIQERASKICPQLGLATIYRNLNRMEEDGAAETITLPGMARSYAIPRKPGYLLLHCRRTGHAEYLDPPWATLPLPPLPQGFQLESYEVILRGSFNGKAKSGQNGKSIESV